MERAPGDQQYQNAEAGADVYRVCSTDTPASDMPVHEALQLQQLAAEAHSLPLLQRCTQISWWHKAQLI